ncbi:hypothetical protein [Actinoplanes philippinensis]|uniref:hypothetical protein n=1 Tax=Actinoplanes philippinensis TaxID=35752 RepID=UPI0033DDCB4C
MSEARAADEHQGMENFREAPATVRVAFVSWLAAVGAGTLETLLVVTGGEMRSGLAAGVAIRAAVFVAAVVVAWQMLAGRRWARLVLTAGLGVAGLGSMVAGPLLWLAEGHSVTAALTGSTPADLFFGAVRTLHVIAVLTATALMFTPPSNQWFRRRPGAVPPMPEPASGGSSPSSTALPRPLDT